MGCAFSPFFIVFSISDYPVLRRWLGLGQGMKKPGRLLPGCKGWGCLARDLKKASFAGNPKFAENP
jgi:hypothetical protein